MGWGGPMSDLPSAGQDGQQGDTELDEIVSAVTLELSRVVQLGLIGLRDWYCWHLGSSPRPLVLPEVEFRFF